MEASPVQFLWRHYEKLLEPARKELAGFIGADPADLVLVTNATTGVNAVIRSIKLRPGDELLTTNLDYNACHNVLVQHAGRAGAKLVVAQVPFPLSDADAIVDAVLGAATERTRLALIDHATSHTGLIFPLRRLIAELEVRGIETLVDGAHAPGMLPLNLAKLSPAYYTGNLHKWVCAPKGAGFLWARKDRQNGLQPSVISHGNNTARVGYSAFQDRFDWPGTFDPTAWFCIGEALRFMGSLLPGGWRELRKRNHDLAVEGRRRICQRFEVAPPCPAAMLGSMATIPLPDRFQNRPRTGRIDPEQQRLYDRFGIEVPWLRIGNPYKRYLRISAQIYNTVEEYDLLAEAVQKL